MIWVEQPLKLVVALGQRTAETPNWAVLKPALIRASRVVAWSVPVEPRSTSVSSLPKTNFPGCWRPASMRPWKVGDDPKGPVQRCVPKKAGTNSHWRPTMVIVPLGEMAISGSLTPSGRSRAVLEKVRLPMVVAARADVADTARIANATKMNRLLHTVIFLLEPMGRSGGKTPGASSGN